MLKIAIIGYGKMGRLRHQIIEQLTDAQVVAVSDLAGSVDENLDPERINEISRFARVAAQRLGIDIIDATTESQLNIFPKMSLHQALAESTS